MKSRIISRNTKTLLYKRVIRSVLTYGAETRVLSKQDEHRLSIFERKILRRIYGPLMDGGRWRIRTSQELYQQYGENDIVKFCKLSKLRWAEHVIRQDDDDLEFFSVSQEESTPEGDPDCVGKMEWRKM
jgi:hypothetical protein